MESEHRAGARSLNMECEREDLIKTSKPEEKIVVEKIKKYLLTNSILNRIL
jgi:hypothetical protein